MSRGYRGKRENDALVNQRGEQRKSRRTAESKQSKPFTGFTSPYRRLNEQALMQKGHRPHTDSQPPNHHHHHHHHHHRHHREKRFSGHRNEPQQQPPPSQAAPSSSCENRQNFARSSPMMPTVAGYSSSGGGGGRLLEAAGAVTVTASGGSGRFPSTKLSADLRDQASWRGELEKDKYHSHSSINPWSDKYARQTEKFIKENKAMKRLNEESVYGKVSWEYDVPQDEGGNQYKNYEKPMDPKEFREQCRRAYVRAAEERHRNAEMSVWGKCDWATYDRYKNSRP